MLSFGWLLDQHTCVTHTYIHTCKKDIQHKKMNLFLKGKAIMFRKIRNSGTQSKMIYLKRGLESK